VAGRFKGYFLRGLAALLPTVLTIWIFIWGYNFIQNNFGIHINRGLLNVQMRLQGYDPANEEAFEKARLRLEEFWVNGWGRITGFLVALIGVCIIGALLASVVGRTLWKMVENFILNTPVVRRVYPYIKQVTDFLLTQEEQKRFFKRVVAVQYPRKGVWSLGFVTGSGIRKIRDSTKTDLVSVLVPTSPTPFTGFVIMVPRKSIIELDITIEEALRFTVSGGVITPGKTGSATFQELDLDAGKRQEPDVGNN